MGILIILGLAAWRPEPRLVPAFAAVAVLGLEAVGIVQVGFSHAGLGWPAYLAVLGIRYVVACVYALLAVYTVRAWRSWWARRAG